MKKIDLLLNDENFLHEVARGFFLHGYSVSNTTVYLRPNYADITSSMVYRALAQLARNGIVTYTPRRNQELESQLKEAFTMRDEEVVVVEGNTQINNDGFRRAAKADVATRAAQIALDKIINYWTSFPTYRRQPVGIALGSGFATQQFCEQLGRLLKQIDNERLELKLNLFALSGGAPVDAAGVSPISFFNLIPEEFVNDRIGLFAPNLVKNGQFGTMKNASGVREAFDRKDEIFLYVSSMGEPQQNLIPTDAPASQQDTLPDDLLSRFLRAQSLADGNPENALLDELLAQDYCGNVQYRPYSHTAPIQETANAYRAITLVELDELQEYARRNDKYVILMARDKSATAMLPLLNHLRVFSTLVLDVKTAQAIMDVPAGERAGESPARKLVKTGKPAARKRKK